MEPTLAVRPGLLILFSILVSNWIPKALSGSSSRKTSGDSGYESDSAPSDKLLDSYIWQLQDSLLNGYNPTVRPVAHPLDPVNVTINLVLFNLVGLDEKDQTFQTNCEVVLIWKDHFLSWNPADFGNVTQTRLDPSKIWKPDIILYNSASTDYNAAVISTYSIVRYDGTVRFLQNGLFTSVCSNLNVDYFPFDQQSCFLKFAPWTMDVSAVHLDYLAETNGSSLDAYTRIGRFKMLSIDAEKGTDKDPCCPNTVFDSITYYINIQRRPMFYIINYIFPSVLINSIGCMVFYVPCDSGEKVTLGISAMLTMVVFLMTMTDAMPPATATPLLSVYYCACVVLVTLEVLFSIMVLNVFHRGQYGKRASDITIAAAFVMSKITFTQMKDPSGHFADRKAEMAEKIRKIFGCLPKQTGNVVATNQIPGNELGESTTSLEDKIAEEEFWRPGVKVVPDYSRAATAASRISQHQQLQRHLMPGKPDNDEFASKFGLAGYKTRGVTVDDMAVKPVVPNPTLKMETILKHVARQADKALEFMKVTQLRHTEEDYKDSLELEFTELARIYDRFFLWMSILGTASTSIGILMSSPYSMTTPGL